MGRSNKPTLTDGDYCVRLIDLDPTVRGVTAMDNDSFASVYINSRHSYDRQRKAFIHEIEHILHDDFDNENRLA